MGGIAVALDLRLEADAGRLDPRPVLLVLDRRADVFMARRSGAEGWILKPLDPIRLRKAVAALLAGGDLARHQLHPRPGGSAVRVGLPGPGSSAAWLARSVRDAEAGGSNPAFPTHSPPPPTACGVVETSKDGCVVPAVSGPA